MKHKEEYLLIESSVSNFAVIQLYVQHDGTNY